MRRRSNSRSRSSGSDRGDSRVSKHHRNNDEEDRRYEDDSAKGEYFDNKRSKVVDGDEGYSRPEPPKSNSLEVFVGGLSWDAKEQNISDLFSECGPVESIKLLMTPEGRFRGAAFVLFDSEASVQKAIELDGSEHMGRRIKVNRSSEKPPPRRTAGDPNTVFVGNLSYQTTEQDLRDFFKGCGEVKDVRLAKDHIDGRPKGFAHIEFAAADSVDQAMRLTGENLNGRDVKVDFAVRKDNSGTRGRRGLDSRRGRGYYDSNRY